MFPPESGICNTDDTIDEGKSMHKTLSVCVSGVNYRWYNSILIILLVKVSK